MKKITLPLFSLLLICGSLHAQDTYLRPYLGYGLGVPGTQAYEYEESSVGYTDRSVIVGLARGLRIGAAYGYFFNENMALELNLNYQNNFGQGVESSSSFRDFDNNGNSFTNVTNFTTTLNSYSISFAPLLHFQMRNQNLKPFMSIGPNVLLAGLSTTEMAEGNNTSTEMVTQFNAAISVGVLGNLGVEIPLSEKINLSVGVQYQMGFFSPNSAEVTEYKVNGTDELNSLPTAAKETNFEKEVSELDDEPFDPDQPSTELKTRLDFSAISLVVGIVIPL